MCHRERSLAPRLSGMGWLTFMLLRNNRFWSRLSTHYSLAVHLLWFPTIIKNNYFLYVCVFFLSFKCLRQCEKLCCCQTRWFLYGMKLRVGIVHRSGEGSWACCDNTGVVGWWRKPLLIFRVFKPPESMFCPYLKLHIRTGMSVWLAEKIKAEQGAPQWWIFPVTFREPWCPRYTSAHPTFFSICHYRDHT